MTNKIITMNKIISFTNKTVIVGLLFLITAATHPSFAQKNAPVAITGSAPGLTGSRIYLQRYENKMFFVIDSSEIINDKFQFTTKVKLPELYGVTIDTLLITPLYVFLDNTSPISIDFDTASHFQHSKVTGSAATDQFTEFQKSRNVKIDEFIQKQPASIVSAFVLYRFYSNRLSPEELKKDIALLDKSLNNTQYVLLLKELVPVLAKRKLGTPAPDFTLNDTEGSPVRLSSHFGKYILIDFWAAWCGPCRRENPNIVRTFYKYRDKGFEVFGVSFDRSKDAWIKAIKDDGLAWTQVSDLAFWNSAPGKLYGVRTIPSNVLIDPKGNIVARNLYGPELDHKLEELLH